MLKERMQLARNAETAHSYLLRIAAILEDALADPNCAPGANKNPHPQVQSGIFVKYIYIYILFN